MEKVRISVVILTKNEEENISDCLESVYGWADEIIVVDDESEDNTLEIAKKYTEKVFIRKWDIEGRQRNWAVSKAKNDWVLMIDADERVTEELKKEIEEILSKNNKKIVAYWIPQRAYLGNKWLRYGGWDAPHIKFYNKNHLKWKEVPEDVVHCGIEITKGFLGATLKNPLIHYNYKNIEDFIDKVNRQSTLEAVKWYLKGRRISLIHGLWKALDRFWRRYVRKKGYKDGFYGFVAAFLSGFYQFVAYSKLREINEKGTYLENIK